jgi:hypothetical protein
MKRSGAAIKPIIQIQPNERKVLENITSEMIRGVKDSKGRRERAERSKVKVRRCREESATALGGQDANGELQSRVDESDNLVKMLVGCNQLGAVLHRLCCNPYVVSRNRCSLPPELGSDS